MDSKTLPKTLMLKDYLLDDLSSCSSSGFRSYPRRQCCTTVRFLLEIDLKNKYQPALPPPPYKPKVKPILQPKLLPPSAAKVSAFQKASVAVINAVKHLPFAGARSSSTSKKKKPVMRTIFPRSLSRKLKRSFWKRGDHKEIYWWTTFNRLDKEELKSPAFSPVVISKLAGDSNSSTTTVNKGKCNSNSNSWSSDSDFTTSTDNSSSGNSEVNSTETVNDAVASKKSGAENVICSTKVGATTDDDPTDSTISSSHGSTTNTANTKKPWPNEEKEQFSPVSTLDCPFDDDDEVSSPFQHRLSHVEGTTKKLMKKIKRFECLTELEPLNLDKRIASSESESESPLNNSSETEVDEEEEDKQTVESRALDWVQALKASMPSYSLKLKTEKLLFDFFKESILDNGDEFKNKLLELAQDWINGKPIDVLLDWKVQENRMAYIRAIETQGKWKNTEVEKQEVILELEVDIFASLMNEVLVDIIFS